MTHAVRETFVKRGGIPLRFDMPDLLAPARRQVNNRLGNATVSLPFISLG